MIALRPRAESVLADRRAFAAFLLRLFGQRRKQLGSILGRNQLWPEGIQPVRRPEELAIEQIRTLFAAVQGNDPDQMSDP